MGGVFLEMSGVCLEMSGVLPGDERSLPGDECAFPGEEQELYTRDKWIFIQRRTEFNGCFLDIKGFAQCGPSSLRSDRAQFSRGERWSRNATTFRSKSTGGKRS